MENTKTRSPQNAGLIEESVFSLVFFRFGQGSKVFPYPSVINAEELVCTGSHVDIVRLYLPPVSYPRKHTQDYQRIPA